MVFIAHSHRITFMLTEWVENSWSWEAKPLPTSGDKPEMMIPLCQWWAGETSDPLLAKEMQEKAGKKHAIPNRVKRASLPRRRPFALLIILWNMDLRLCLSQPRVDKGSRFASRALGRAEPLRAPCSGLANRDNPGQPPSHSTEKTNFCSLKPPPKSVLLINNWTCS